MIHTVWPHRIGTLRDADPPGCHWCGGGFRDYAVTAAGAVICRDCTELVREVGDGMLEVTHIQTSYQRVGPTMQRETMDLAADLVTPLRVQLCIQYNGQGFCWLEGLPADDEARAIMEDLVMYEDDETLGINGATRADLLREAGQYALRDYAESLQTLLEKADTNDWEEGEEAYTLECVERYRRRLRRCTCALGPSESKAAACAASPIVG